MFGQCVLCRFGGKESFTGTSQPFNAFGDPNVLVVRICTVWQSIGTLPTGGNSSILQCNHGLLQCLQNLTHYFYC